MTPAETLCRAQAKARRESLELLMLHQLRALKLDAGLEREHRFHAERGWRFDFSWPARAVALEVDGGTWVPGGGGHQRGEAFTKDCEKLNEATCAGWRVLRVTGDQVRSGAAIAWVERALRVQ